MTQRLLALPLLAALAGCEFDLDDVGTKVQEEFHYSFDLKPGGRITVENFNGPVEIYAWDQDKVEINGAKYASRKDLLDLIRIETHNGPDFVSVASRRPEGRDGRGNLGARYSIHVPRKSTLERVASSNGGIRVDGLEGPARLQTSNGKVRVMGMKGDLDARTSNGGVEIRLFEGGAMVETSNGGVTAEGVRGHFQATTSNGGVDAEITAVAAGRPVRVRTSNGGVKLRLPGPIAADVEARTSNGPIELRLPAAANARLRAHTSNAPVTNEFPLAPGARVSKHSLDGAIGSGGPLLDLVTSNGAIRLTRN